MKSYYWIPDVTLYRPDRKEYEKLRFEPTWEDWKTMHRQLRVWHWPWLQTSRFNLPPRPPSPPPDSLMAFDFTDQDHLSDGDYEPSSDESSSSGGESEYDFVDSDSDAELEDLREATDTETPHPAWCWCKFKQQTTEEERAHKSAVLRSRVPELLAAEKAAASAWNPDAFASSLCEFYTLLIDMGHFPSSAVAFPPHTSPPVDTDLARKLGYAESAVSLMPKLPYVNYSYNRLGWYFVSSNSTLADYRRESDLKDGRCPLVPWGAATDPPHPALDSQMLPLTLPEDWYGLNVLLDCDRGIVRAQSSYGPLPETVEWHVYSDGSNHETYEGLQHDYRRAPMIPAAEYLGTVIEAYRSLERLPVLEVNNGMRNVEELEGGMKDPVKAYGEGRVGYQYHVDEGNMQKEAVAQLYRECGWGTANWRREEFLERWEISKGEIEETVQRKRKEFEKAHGNPRS